MPRAMPWLAQSAKSKKPTSSSPAPRNKRASSPDELVDEDLNTTGVVTSERRKRSRPAARTPSTSPPPAPPDVECMRVGFSADDAWMMVEDEFLTTAKMYTQHIHHAEYVRLKRLAKSRGQGTLRAIERPTDGRTAQSTGMRLRLEAEATGDRIQNGLRGMVEEEESDEEDPFMQDPQLAGLMTGSQRTTHDLSGLAKAKANTRAAAGFAKSPHKQRAVDRDIGTTVDRDSMSPSRRPTAASMVEDSETTDDDDDDLDAPFVKSSKPKPQNTTVSNHRSLPTSKGKEVERTGSTGLFKRFATKSSEQQQPKRHSETLLDRRSPSKPKVTRPDYSTKASSSTNEGFTYQRSERSQTASDFLAKRRVAREKLEQEEKRKAKQVDDVPTFLI